MIHTFYKQEQKTVDMWKANLPPNRPWMANPTVYEQT